MSDWKSLGTKILPHPLKKHAKRLLFAGLAGIALILLSGLFAGEEQEQVKETQLTAEQYTQMLEDNLRKTVQEIVGGKPSVMVTLETGVEYVYANEEKADSNEDTAKQQKKDSSEKKVVVVNSDSGEIPLTVTQIMPTVKGVVIVCNGGGDETVQAIIKNTVTTALAIDGSKVCVTGTLLKQ